ncbi:hypothetical protein EV421DRAFT_133841 [Armillaria borealis]|uniref:Uncharacterized protein n=1 Tax=Armillaria borealis TaxID=47425 RepID=A0AA39MEZ8_9AGAR|nr:hypothetical protein EV421DRAFT_133841 [Armillaria borealis]
MLLVNVEVSSSLDHPWRGDGINLAGSELSDRSFTAEDLLSRRPMRVSCANLNDPSYQPIREEISGLSGIGWSLGHPLSPTHPCFILYDSLNRDFGRCNEGIRLNVQQSICVTQRNTLRSHRAEVFVAWRMSMVTDVEEGKEAFEIIAHEPARGGHTITAIFGARLDVWLLDKVTISLSNA